MEYVLLRKMGLSDEFIQSFQVENNFEIARVISQNRGRFQLQTETNIVSASVSGKFMYNAVTDIDYPQIGDWVSFSRADESSGVIDKVFPRYSELLRKASGKNPKAQMIATNIDIVFICMGMDLDYNIRRLERYLGIVWQSRAIPVVVLTKSDMATQYHQQLNEVASISIGADVITCSNQMTDGYDSLMPYLKPCKTLAFIGSSGVGKSTMINFILSEDVMKTNSVRNDSRGRHTTTSRELFLSPYGCSVIDTPGMREIQIEESNLDQAFQDIEMIAEKCRFRDCTHTVEPGCQVLCAVEEGELEYSRLKNYHKMVRELKRIDSIKKTKSS